MLKLFRNWRKSGEITYSRSTLDNETDIKLSKESEHFFTIFPELVWKHIIKQLDFNDLKNLSNASPFFRNLLLRKRIVFLFKDVFEVVAPRLLGNINESGSMARLAGNRWSNEKEVQVLVFNCRLVCRAWNKSILKLAQEINPNWNWDTGNRDKYAVFKFITEAYEFTSKEEICAFQSEIAKLPSNWYSYATGNPFFGETIFLSISPLSNYGYFLETPFHDSVEILLHFFGKFVSNCQIHLSSSISDPSYESEPTYKYLVKLLGLLPNLKHLSLVNYDNFYADEIANIKLVKLEKLASLSMHSVSGTLCNEIVKANLHVSRLVIEQSNTNLRNAGYLLHSFENLEHLELIWCNWEEIARLNGFDNDCWKVKTLKLKYFVAVGEKYPEWSDVFNILSSKLGKNLEELELALPEVTDEELKSKLVDEMFEFRLLLPKLKKIDLTVKNDVTFDFLLGMSESLESLRITSLAARQRGELSKNYVKAKSKETIELLSCYDKLYGSNIWKLSPKLKSVQLCDGFNFSWSYNRNDWRKKKMITQNLLKRWFSTN